MCAQARAETMMINFVVCRRVRRIDTRCKRGMIIACGGARFATGFWMGIRVRGGSN
jgi:hypothetical protein